MPRDDPSMAAAFNAGLLAYRAAQRSHRAWLGSTNPYLSDVDAAWAWDLGWRLGVHLARAGSA